MENFSSSLQDAPPRTGRQWRAGWARTTGWVAISSAVFNGIAIAYMGLVLAPGTMANPDLADRLLYIHSYAPAYAFGWFLWMFASMSLIAVFFILSEYLNTRYRLWMRFALIIATVGAGADITSDVISMTAIPLLAHQFVNEPALSAMTVLSFQVWDWTSVALTGGVGNTSYVIAGTLFTWVMFKTPAFPRYLAMWFALLWAVAGLASIALVWAQWALPPTVAGSIFIYLPWAVMLAKGYLWQPESKLFEASDSNVL